jgi:hypothetical protein
MADSPYDLAVLADSPRYYWPLTETLLTNGSPIADRTALRPGAVVGSGLTVTTGPSPRAPGAVQFPGDAASSVDVGTGAMLAGLNLWSMDFYVRLTSTTWGGAVAALLAAGSYQWGFRFRLPPAAGDATIEYTAPIWAGFPSSVLRTVAFPFVTGRWYHVTVTFSGGAGTTTGWLTFYVDAQQIKRDKDLYSQWFDDTGLAHALGKSGVAAEPLTGALSRVAVYETELSRAQVEAHYIAGVHVPGTDAYSLAVLDSEPLHFWRMDDAVATAGAVIADAVAGRHGVVVNSGLVAQPAGPTPELPGCLDWPSSGSPYVDLGTALLLGNRTAWTLEWWALLTTLGANRLMFGIGPPTGTPNLSLHASPGNAIIWNIAGTEHTSNLVFQAGVWYHLAATLTASERRLYVNGGLFMGPTAGPATMADDTTRLKRIGLYVNGTLPWYGRMSRVAIYDRALTSDEIAIHYAQRSAPAGGGGAGGALLAEVLTRIGQSALYTDGSKDTLFDVLYHLAGIDPTVPG